MRHSYLLMFTIKVDETEWDGDVPDEEDIRQATWNTMGCGAKCAGPHTILTGASLVAIDSMGEIAR